MQLADLKDKRIGILGFGKEGQAVADVLLEQAVSNNISLLCEHPLADNIETSLPVRIGAFTVELFANFDVLIKSPGISIYHPAISAAQQAGITITSGTNLWFAENPNAQVIAITGTKGKSTTAALTAHLLASAGMDVQLAGNIGVPLISRLETDADVWILELSSFQLADLEAQPDVAVLVSLFPEHLDWHGGETHYFADKLRLLSMAKNVLIEHGLLTRLQTDPELNNHLPSSELVQSYHDTNQGWLADEQGLVFNSDLRLPLEQMALRGHHNHINACAALSIADHYELDQAQVLHAMTTFKPLPHRLEVVAELDDVLFINDSIATTPMATIKALQAFQDRSVILIAGGFDRGLGWLPVIDFIQQNEACLRAVIALPDNGSDLLNGLAENHDDSRYITQCVDDMASAVVLARQLMQPHDVVLLSPGAASFSQYRNFEDRGADFRHQVIA